MIEARPPADITLRPVRADDIGWLAAISCDIEAVGAHNWPGVPRDPAELERELSAAFELNGFVSEQAGRLIVEVAGPTRIGDVSWRPERWGPSPRSWCPAFGIALLPDYRGCGYGTLAQRQLVDYLFESFDINRVQSDTAADNPAEQRALEKAGLRREGVVRGAEYRDGRYHDHVLYGILRDEWRSAGSVRG